jgi:hypothetical protein
MSFKKYLEETNNASGFSKEQKFVLLIGKELEDSNYKLKTNNDENIFKNFKEQEGKFTYTFTKDNMDYNLTVQNKKDGKYEIALSNDKRATSEEIKIDNYFKEGDSSLLTNYMKERIKNIEVDPMLYNEPKKPLQFNNTNFDINRIEMNDNFNRVNDNNFFPNPNTGIGSNFANIGYNDLHGDLPNFVPGYNDYYGRPRGNLMGPEAFNNERFGGGIRYDPMTPFGPRFDFIPQYDGPMRRNPRNDIDIGMPGGNGFIPGNNGFGGGGYNPFI